MARVFITGSSDGLGRMAAQLLIEQGHGVVLHARSQQRGKEALAAVPGAESVVIGDLASIAQTRDVADQVNGLGSFDAVIHNAGVGYREPRRIATEDGLPHVFAVNTLAPYILTALIQKPKRLVYLSSGLHQRGDASLKDLVWEQRALARAAGLLRYQAARCAPGLCGRARWPVYSPTLSSPAGCRPRWAAPPLRTTWMPAHRTQVWLAVSDDKAAMVTGEYFFHMRLRPPNPAARDTESRTPCSSACASVFGSRPAGS